MNETSESLRRGSAWMIAGRTAALGFQAVYFVLMGRVLGSREYGAFVGVVALVAVLSQFSSLGMEMVMLRDVSRDRARFAAAWGAALRMAAIGFVALLLIALAFGHIFLNPGLRLLIPWIAVSDGLFGKAAQLAGRAFQSVGQIRVMAQLTAAMNAGRALLAAALFAYVHWGGHADALVWARIYWIAPFVVGLVSFALVTARLGWPRWEPMHRRDWSEGLSFSLSNSSISLYNDIDKTFLVSLGQTFAAGIYGAAYRVADMATVPLYSVYAAATPRLFRAGGEGVEQAHALSGRILRRTSLYGVAAAAALFFGAPLVPWLFGPSFAESVPALRWLALLPLLRVLHYAWGTTITASASQWNRTATQIAAATLNLALCAWMIPRWSWQGAAWASLLTDGSLAALSWMVLSRVRGVQRSKAGRSAAHISSPSSLIKNA
ncbi:MAG TPA: oligosaccharide flippase family protein [Acidobacteriaceae bacterium]|nr:oligosaccharide flippase family protein [Acidobacteriaceae bacterium]